MRQAGATAGVCAQLGAVERFAVVRPAFGPHAAQVGELERDSSQPTAEEAKDVVRRQGAGMVAGRGGSV